MYFIVVRQISQLSFPKFKIIFSFKTIRLLSNYWKDLVIRQFSLCFSYVRTCCKEDEKHIFLLPQAKNISLHITIWQNAYWAIIKNCCPTKTWRLSPRYFRTCLCKNIFEFINNNFIRNKIIFTQPLKSANGEINGILLWF